MIGLVAVTAAGRGQAARLAAAWPDARLLDGAPGAALAAAWRDCTGLVCFLATGATVRLVAPLLRGKDTDPGVVCVDEAGRFAVALLGGHHGGANALAHRVAATLGAAPVVTTASDAAGATALDSLPAAGFQVEGALAGVGAALLSGEPVDLLADDVWPLPPLAATPARSQTPGRAALVVTDRAGEAEPGQVLVRPPSLVAGMGASRGASEAEAAELLEAVLAAAGRSPRALWALATVEAKSEEPGLVALAARLGLPLLTHPAHRLAEVAVPHPSEVVRAAVGTPSVAEAAALASAGRGGRLVVGKAVGARVTVALASRPPRGRLALVGLGPGARDLLTPRAQAELARASVVVGLDQYVEGVRDLLRPGTRVLASGLGAEEERAATAVAQARAGHAVALVGSGDAGVYAMAAPALDLLVDPGEVEVVGVPGITAALAAAALLGAPLGHDAVTVSLSDLHTPWPQIQRRVQAAAEADLVVTFYNPRSAGRDWQLGAALDLLRAARPGGTPVGVVRDASRPGERVLVTTLAAVDPTRVDMHCVVVVGSTASRVVGGRFVTPRGYRWAQ